MSRGSSPMPRPIAFYRGLLAAVTVAAVAVVVYVFVGRDTGSGGGQATSPAATDAPKTATTTPAPPVDGPQAEELLKQVVEAAGGAANFDAVKSYYMEGTVETIGLGIGGTARTWWKGGDFYNEMDLPGV